MNMRVDGAAITARTRAIVAAMEAKQAIRDFNEATTDFLATPSATNYSRVVQAMLKHQACKYGDAAVLHISGD